jgi:hypothetical protein
MPSAVTLGGDEILERHGPIASALFHIGDFFLWSALITGLAVLVRGSTSRRDLSEAGARDETGHA